MVSFKMVFVFIGIMLVIFSLVGFRLEYQLNNTCKERGLEYIRVHGDSVCLNGSRIVYDVGDCDLISDTCKLFIDER